MVLAFDAVGREMNSLGDQYPGTRVAVIVGELDGRHCDREPGCAGQRREQHLGLHLRLAAVTNRIVHIAGELHEQVGVGVRVRFVVLDAQQKFAAGASARNLVEPADAGDGVVGSQRTRGAECLSEKRCATGAQRGRVRGYGKCEVIAGDPTIVCVDHQVCSAARTNMWLTATRRSRVTMYSTASAMSSGANLTMSAV